MMALNDSGERMETTGDLWTEEAGRFPFQAPSEPTLSLLKLSLVRFSWLAHSNPSP